MRPPLLLLDDVKPWIGAELPALRTILWPLGIHALTPTKGDGYRLVKQRTLHLGDLVRGHRLMMQYTESLAVTQLSAAASRGWCSRAAISASRCFPRLVHAPSEWRLPRLGKAFVESFATLRRRSAKSC